MVSLSSVVAVIGLVRDNAAVVIGAMTIWLICLALLVILILASQKWAR
ncbi:MAG: hypothetical protein KAT00_01695 [Planctomycetes bacterium]|nr:hypothetical protein [Planctomycetota bacterium]